MCNDKVKNNILRIDWLLFLNTCFLSVIETHTHITYLWCEIDWVINKGRHTENESDREERTKE